MTSSPTHYKQKSAEKLTWKDRPDRQSTHIWWGYGNSVIGILKNETVEENASNRKKGKPVRDDTYRTIGKKPIVIAGKNTELLIGSSGQQHHDKQQTGNFIRGGSDSLEFEKTMIKTTTCLILFFWKEFTNEEQSCTTMNTLDTVLAPNHQYYQTSNSNTTIPLETALLICQRGGRDYRSAMQSYQGQTNDKASMNLMVHRLSEKLDRGSKRWSNGLLRLGIPSNKAKKGTSSATSSSSFTSSSPSTTSSTSTASSPFDATELATTMQFPPSYRLPFSPSLGKNDWNTSSIYSQLQKQQDMKSKIEALEQQLKHDHQVFEKQRTMLLEEIKMKDKQLLEKEQQWEARWSAKMQNLQHQLETERKTHEDNICEWKTRYQAAMDTEQQKHYRRLTYFHERLTAKNIEYAELEQLLARSAPVSPIRSPVDPEGLKPVSKTMNEQNSMLSLNTSTIVDSDDDHTTQPQSHPYYRWRRSSSLDTGSISPKPDAPHYTTQFMIADPAVRKSRLELAVARHASNTRPRDRDHLSSPLLRMDDLYACELQDMTLRHQASVDNMAAEYEETKVELLEQHRRDRELWKLEHESELQNACMQLVQDHERHMNQVNQTWQQKWDDMVAQNKRDQAELQKQWDQQAASDKLAWEDAKSSEHDTLKKQLGWATYELNLMLKEHKTATILAKQLNLAIDPNTDVEDMKLTLVSLLETGIDNVSSLDSRRCHSEKPSEPVPLFGLWNLSF